MQNKTNISLIGYMGSGKTTIAQLLAKMMNYPLIDLDEYIEEKEKLKISEIFSLQGNIHFRKLERKYLEEILSSENSILSMGGGTPVYFDNMDLINQHSHSFYLRMNPTNLTQRLLKEKSHRPMISHLETEEELQEFIAKHLFERIPYYEKAKFHIDSNGKISHEIVKEILAKIKNLF